MKIRFLGTAAAEGTPAFYCDCPVCAKAARLGGRNIRTRSQVLINDDLLIDYPPDTYLHMLNLGLDLKRIHNVLITHSHGDHFFLHDILMKGYPENAGSCREPVSFYGNAAVAGILEPYAKDENQRLRVHAARPFQEILLEGYRVMPLRALHDPAEECLLYAVESPDGKRFLLGNDTGYFPEDTMEQIRGMVFDAISLDCTTGKERDGGNHMGFADILEMRRRLLENHSAGEQTMWIAQHFSHNGGFVYDEAVTLLEPEGFLVAYDGMTITI